MDSPIVRIYRDAVSTPSDPQGEPRQPDQGPSGGEPGDGRPGQYGEQPPYGQAPQGEQPQYGRPPYGDQPQYGPQYGQPPYGQPPYGEQPQYGQPPYGQGPYGSAYGQQPGYGAPAYPNQPYGSGQGQYAYNPYGSSPVPPAGLGKDAELAARPAAVTAALVLLILSALPFLLLGAVLVLGAGTATDTLPPETLAPVLEAGFDPATFLRTMGILFLVPALLHVLFAIIAFRGNTAGRAGSAVLTVLFALAVIALVAIALGGSAAAGVQLDLASLLIFIVPLLLAGTGVALLFRPESARFYDGPVH